MNDQQWFQSLPFGTGSRQVASHGKMRALCLVIILLACHSEAVQFLSQHLRRKVLEIDRCSGTPMTVSRSTHCTTPSLYPPITGPLKKVIDAFDSLLQKEEGYMESKMMSKTFCATSTKSIEERLVENVTSESNVANQNILIPATSKNVPSDVIHNDAIRFDDAKRFDVKNDEVINRNIHSLSLETLANAKAYKKIVGTFFLMLNVFISILIVLFMGAFLYHRLNSRRVQKKDSLLSTFSVESKNSEIRIECPASSLSKMELFKETPPPAKTPEKSVSENLTITEEEPSLKELAINLSSPVIKGIVQIKHEEKVTIPYIEPPPLITERPYQRLAKQIWNPIDLLDKLRHTPQTMISFSEPDIDDRRDTHDIDDTNDVLKNFLETTNFNSLNDSPFYPSPVRTYSSPVDSFPKVNRHVTYLSNFMRNKEEPKIPLKPPPLPPHLESESITTLNDIQTESSPESSINLDDNTLARPHYVVRKRVESADRMDDSKVIKNSSASKIFKTQSVQVTNSFLTAQINSPTENPVHISKEDVLSDPYSKFPSLEESKRFLKKGKLTSDNTKECQTSLSSTRNVSEENITTVENPIEAEKHAIQHETTLSSIKINNVILPKRELPAIPSTESVEICQPYYLEEDLFSRQLDPRLVQEEAVNKEESQEENQLLDYNMDEATMANDNKRGILKNSGAKSLWTIKKYVDFRKSSESEVLIHIGDESSCVASEDGKRGSDLAQENDQILDELESYFMNQTEEGQEENEEQDESSEDLIGEISKELNKMPGGLEDCLDYQNEALSGDEEELLIN